MSKLSQAIEKNIKSQKPLKGQRIKDWCFEKQGFFSKKYTLFSCCSTDKKKEIGTSDNIKLIDYRQKKMDGKFGKNKYYPSFQINIDGKNYILDSNQANNVKSIHIALKYVDYYLTYGDEVGFQHMKADPCGPLRFKACPSTKEAEQNKNLEDIFSVIGEAQKGKGLTDVLAKGLLEVEKKSTPEVTFNHWGYRSILDKKKDKQRKNRKKNPAKLSDLKVGPFKLFGGGFENSYESQGTQNPWINHVKNYSKINQISYGQAMKDPVCKYLYHNNKNIYL